MVTKNDQMNELQKKSLEAAMRLAQLSISNSQRIIEIQVDTAKSLFEEGMQHAKAQATMQDPKDLFDLRTHYAQMTAEKMLACARGIAEVTAQAQVEVGKLVGEQLTTGSQDIFEAMQKMFKGLPIADQNTLSAFQTAMDTARASFEQITRASTDAFKAFSKNTAASSKSKK